MVVPDTSNVEAGVRFPISARKGYTMETWDQFKTVIHTWATGEITDEQFHDYLQCTQFDSAADGRVACVFLKHLHDGGYHGHSRVH